MEDERIDTGTIEEFMTFYLGGTQYAIGLTKVREILTYPEFITPLPNCSDFMKGLINLRGEVVPVLDLRIKFDINAEYNESTAVIAVVTSDRRMLGIVVDSVDDVEGIDIDSLAGASSMSSAIPARYLRGYSVHDDEGMIVIMDIESVLSKKEIAS